MNENSLGKKSNFIPEVFAGANNIKNRELKKASKMHKAQAVKIDGILKSLNKK